MATRPRIVIIGAGFAGLSAARLLAKQAVDVILIDRNNYHTFTPLLYQVATCGLDPSAVAYPVRSIFRDKPNVRFLLGKVTAIDSQAQTVIVNADTGEIRHEAYDYLLVAGGSQTNWFNSQSIETNSFGLRDLSDALALRNHVLKLFEKAAWTDDAAERAALMTIVVVGGGATGLETAGALHELYNHVLEQEFDKNNNMEVRVLLLEGSDNVLPPFPEHLRQSANEQLSSIGVEVRTNTLVETVHSNGIRLRDGSVIPTHTVIWAAGIVASPLAKMLNIPLERGGRVPVSRNMQVLGLNNIYAAGDMSYLRYPDSEETYAGVIQVAKQQAVIVAKNILHSINGEALEDFQYHDLGIMATIGRRRAVAYLFNRIPLKGFFAWMAWLALHLVTLLGMRNRAQVFINWVWDYIFYDRSVRIIVEGVDRKQRHPELFEAQKVESVR